MRPMALTRSGVVRIGKGEVMARGVEEGTLSRQRTETSRMIYMQICLGLGKSMSTVIIGEMWYEWRLLHDRHRVGGVVSGESLEQSSLIVFDLELHLISSCWV